MGREDEIVRLRPAKNADICSEFVTLLDLWPFLVVTVLFAASIFHDSKKVTDSQEDSWWE
jgi:hypothetical protein